MRLRFGRLRNDYHHVDILQFAFGDLTRTLVLLHALSRLGRAFVVRYYKFMVRTDPASANCKRTKNGLQLYELLTPRDVDHHLKINLNDNRDLKALLDLSKLRYFRVDLVSFGEFGKTLSQQMQAFVVHLLRCKLIIH